MSLLKRFIHSKRGVGVELVVILLVLFLVGIIWLGLGTGIDYLYNTWATSMSTPDVDSSVLLFMQIVKYLGFFIVIGCIVFLVVQAQRQQNPAYGGY